MPRIDEIVSKQREFFNTGNTRSYDFRRDQLKKLYNAIKNNQEKLNIALWNDFRKPAFETYATEVGFSMEEIRNHIKHLKKWMRKKNVSTPITQFPSKSWIQSEPYGISLIIGPWNYPFNLVVTPLIGAISAGNCVIIKPSRQSPHTSKLFANLINGIYDEQYVYAIEGEEISHDELLNQPVDHIFFTGSTRIGKIIMHSAAERLIPVILELGGKSPCIVHNDVDIQIAARRIVWGKFLNAGQTCVAPDYCLVHEDIKEEFIKALIKWIGNHFCRGENNKLCTEMIDCIDFPRIINQNQYDRLVKLIDQSKLRFGGEFDPDHNYISPTIMDNVNWEDSVMKEEIFGPILPILTFKNINTAISEIRDRPRPLALYIFTKNKEFESNVINSIAFGGGCVNDSVVHLANFNLPFGGVGASGLGRYHGKTSFEAFSYKKSILKKAWWLDLPFRYPPYKSIKMALLKKLMH